MMFYWEGGLKLAGADLAIDFRSRQPRAFISHAHGDHIARHEYTFCTPETARLVELRLGRRTFREMPYRQPVTFGGLRLTTYPAGHCLGSAMLLAEDGDTSLLYTGDFKLGPSSTAERADPPRAETLVIESTYGRPGDRLPPREQAIGELVGHVRDALRDGTLPVVHAYILGKGQEVTRILTDHGIPVVQHRHIYRVSEVYERCGVRLGQVEPLGERVPPGRALVAPPRWSPDESLGRTVRIAATGWAVDPSARYRWKVDHAVALSDHADYAELLETIDRVQPTTIYCTHGPAGFVDRLLERGHDARLLGRPTQQWLF
jgi:Cft2 family RNA processing exonuclease